MAAILSTVFARKIAVKLDVTFLLDLLLVLFLQHKLLATPLPAVLAVNVTDFFILTV